MLKCVRKTSLLYSCDKYAKSHKMTASYSPGINIRPDGNISENRRKWTKWYKISVTPLVSCLLLFLIVSHVNGADRTDLKTNAGESQNLDELWRATLKEMKFNCSGMNL